MKIKYNREVDILYIHLMDETIEDSDEAQPGLAIDYDAAGIVVGFEIMNASKKMARPASVELEIA